MNCVRTVAHMPNNLTVGYLEETRLRSFYQNISMTKFVNTWKTILFRYINNGFLALPTKIKTLLIKQALNELHPAIQFTMETGNKNKY